MIIIINIYLLSQMTTMMSFNARGIQLFIYFIIENGINKKQLA